MKAGKKIFGIVCLRMCEMKRVILFLFILAILPTYDSVAYETFTGYFLDQRTTGGCWGASLYVIGDYELSQSFIPTGDFVGAISFEAASSSGDTSFYSNTVIEIRSDNGGFPSDIVLGTASVISADLPPLGVTAAVFDPLVSVTPGETYYIVLYMKPSATKDIQPMFSNENYPDGHAYYKEPGGQWTQGTPWGMTDSDYCFSQYWYGETVVPVAATGEDIVADANETIVLDASGSFDSDGAIVNYMWKTVPCRQPPSSRSGQEYCNVIYSGPDPVCEAKAIGMVEEVIELTVTDNLGVKGVDTLSVFNKRVENIELTPGPQGPQGEPGITPNEIAEMQARIKVLEEQNAQLQQMVEKNRYLLEQLPQLKKQIEELIETVEE